MWGHPFVRNVAVVASGTAAAQAITMVFSPLITRIYGPEAFGLLGTFLAVVAVATPIAALAYPIAIVLPRNDRDALGLAWLSLYLSSAIALLVSLALWMSGNRIIIMLGIEPIGPYLLLIPLVMLFSAWMQIAQQWLIRKREFGEIARAAAVHSFFVNSAKSGVGWLHPFAAVLIIISTLGHAFHAALLFIGARKQYRASLTEPNQPTSLKKLAYQHRDFPLYRMPQNFINAVSQSLPTLMLAAFFGPASAGFYTLGRVVMGIPSTLIGVAVSDVFYPRITEAERAGENLSRLILKATGALFLIGIVPFALVVIFGPWVFGFVFGHEWMQAGEYARWLAVFFLFNLINKPSVAAVPALQIQRGLLIYEILSTGGKILSLSIGFYWFESEIWAIALFSIIGSFSYIIMMLWILYHAGRRLRY